MAADDEEAAKNDNYGADAVALALSLLGGGNITDKEGVHHKENVLMVIAAPAEAIYVGVVASERLKEKAIVNMDKAFFYFSSNPLSHEIEPVTPLMAEKED